MRRTVTVRVARAWYDLRVLINFAYAREYALMLATDPRVGALRAFSGDEERDRLEELLADEAREERRHRRLVDKGMYSIPVGTAAKLLIVREVLRGIESATPLEPALLFVMREPAYKARLLGSLLRPYAMGRDDLLNAWRDLPSYDKAVA